MGGRPGAGGPARGPRTRECASGPSGTWTRTVLLGCPVNWGRICSKRALNNSKKLPGGKGCVVAAGFRWVRGRPGPDRVVAVSVRPGPGLCRAERTGAGGLSAIPGPGVTPVALSKIAGSPERRLYLTHSAGRPVHVPERTPSVTPLLTPLPGTSSSP